MKNKTKEDESKISTNQKKSENDIYTHNKRGKVFDNIIIKEKNPKVSKKTFIQIFISILLPFLFWLLVVKSSEQLWSFVFFMPLIVIWLIILFIWLIIDSIMSIKSRKSNTPEFVIFGVNLIFWLCFILRISGLLG